jgi:putative sporulation protein YyaC
MFSKTAVRQTYINTDNPTALDIFNDALFSLINKGLRKGSKSVVFVCIGTDRATGDCLGPLIGYKINNLKYSNVYVHGCLENPVHAKNIENVIKYIYSNYDSPYIVAIDACLGRMDHVGYITVGEGSIKPGSGVNKDLAPVGDMYITGIVNFGGFMDFLVLQNTRLNLVMKWLTDIHRYKVCVMEN